MSAKLQGLASHSPPMITVSGLSGSIREGVGRKRRLFEPVDFQLQPGSLLAITGRNGVGKTSLLRLLAGSKTFVEFEGLASTIRGAVPIEHLHTLYRAWFVETGHEIFPALKVRDNLEVVLLASRQRWNPDVDSLVEKWKCKELLMQEAGRLSGGQLRRVQIMMAVLSGANAIFLDEPLTGFDEEGIATFRGLVADVLDNDVIAVITEHHVDFLEGLDMRRLELLESSFSLSEAT